MFVSSAAPFGSTRKHTFLVMPSEAKFGSASWSVLIQPGLAGFPMLRETIG